ncbi:hypothetical protein BB561_002828 [Smittium simulii]|uniref:Phosphoadenosine phosphosulphate reductase domain-containing protein n=1 Tax=Smittium simulii TaxID=133385 RepID=A0A2T9YP08_9FUNG|nr:hypothetical protein BB561_002828 [Smittium simulii]
MFDYKLPFNQNGNIDISEKELQYLNSQLEKLSSEQIIKWAASSFPRLFQETAFGPSGNVIMDMIYSSNIKVPVIFIDTLYHFDETLDLAKIITDKYNADLHIYKPNGCSSRKEFVEIHGDNLWDLYPNKYDFLVKAEPGNRAYSELRPKCVITGRRRSQKGKRESLKILEIVNIEIDGRTEKLFKLNPLAKEEWTFQKIKSYLLAYQVPYNTLLNKGYKSIGDIHSTSPVNGDDDERSGRWKGTDKTECGLHSDYFLMKTAFIARQI